MSSSIRRMLTDLVKTYSPTGHEEQAIEKFDGYLEQLGFQQISRDRAGNSIGKISGTGISVTLCGHIDTVPGKLRVTTRNGLLTGRGTVDAKSSLISLLHGARLAKDRGFGGTLQVIAAVGEEGPGKGIIEIAGSQQKTDYAILGEPSGTTGITTGYKGRLLIDASFRSGSYHASAPWMGSNAVDLAINSWQKVKERYGSNRDFSKVSAALTSINGGKAGNVTPSRSSITIDVRYPPSRSREGLFDEFEGLLMPEIEAGEAEIKLRSYVEPYVSNMKTPLLGAFKNAIRENTGVQPKLIFKSGSGDMNILGTEWKIPCVTYGPGNPQLSHTNDEVISIEEVEQSAEIVAEALLNLESLHPPES